MTRSDRRRFEGEISDWTAFVSALYELDALRAKKGAGLRITETVTSPTLSTQIRDILSAFPEAQWHQFEPVNRDNVREGPVPLSAPWSSRNDYFAKARLVLALDSGFSIHALRRLAARAGSLSKAAA